MMRIGAVLLILLFYAAYFLKQIRMARQGIRANQMGRSNKPTRMRSLEIALLIVTYAHAAVQVLSVFCVATLGETQMPMGWRVLGFVIAVCGIASFVAAMATMRESWRAGIDPDARTALVTRGIYRYSRNPAFLGFDLHGIGLLLMLPNVVHAVITVAHIVILHIWILQEEAYLPTVFGEAYTAYRRRTPRYIGFL